MFLQIFGYIPFLKLVCIKFIQLFRWTNLNIQDLKQLFENNSTFKFAYEIGYDRLHFLDLNSSYKNKNEISTEVYVKPTNTSNLLNDLS